MTLKVHINLHVPNVHVPGVRLPIRKERKSRLRPLDSEDEDYTKGERVPLTFGWRILIDRQIVVRLFQDGWLHKNKNLPHVYRIFQIEAPESLIQPYLQY